MPNLQPNSPEDIFDGVEPNETKTKPPVGLDALSERPVNLASRGAPPPSLEQVIEQKKMAVAKPVASAPEPPRPPEIPVPPPIRPVPPQAAPVPDQKPAEKTEDILSEVDLDKSNIRRPALSERPAEEINLPFSEPKAGARVVKEKPLLKNPRFYIIISVVFGAIILGVGAWFIYSNYFSSPQNLFPAELPGQPDITETQPPATEQTPAAAELDSDLDGLSDHEEKLYGIDPTKVDTDNDELTDRDEVKIFKTDPNIADTDNDGYVDGIEVRNGYNPLGEGMLLKIKP